MRTKVHKLPEGYLLNIDSYKWLLLQARAFSPIAVAGNDCIAKGKPVPIKNCPTLVKHVIKDVQRTVNCVYKHKKRSA